MNNTNTRPPTVLVVSNNKVVYTMFHHALGDTAWEIQTASTLQEAVQILFARGPIDLVACESQLPDGNAVALQDWLRDQLIVPLFLILEVDLDEGPKNRHQRRSFLRKPFTSAQLRAAVNLALEHLPTLSAACHPADEVEHRQAS